MSSCISSSHLTIEPMSGDNVSVPKQKTVASLRVIFDVSSHQNLLAAAEKAKGHFGSLPVSENSSSPVTEKIIQQERGVANNAAARAREANIQAPSIINPLRYQCDDQNLLKTVAALESRLKIAADQATLSAAQAASATQKQTVQVDTKSAALHAADARLALEQLKQLEPQRAARISKQEEGGLKKAEEEYKNASKELAKLIPKTISPVEAAEEVRDDHLDLGQKSAASNRVVGNNSDDKETADGGTWRDVSDQEARRLFGTWRDVSDQEAIERFGGTWRDVSEDEAIDGSKTWRKFPED